MRLFRKFFKGLNIKPKTTTESDEQGDLEVLTSDGKIRYHNGTSISPIVTEAHSATLTNKSIDADNNTITNIENADIKTGAAIARSKLASGSANRLAVNDGSGVLSDAAAITASRALESDANGIPVASAVTATELGYVSGVTSSIQTQLNGKALATDLTDHINDATDAHDASAISSVPSGNLAATDVQGALNELQSDIDSRALASDLSTHISDTTTHGTTGDIVGTSDTQVITNKDIDGGTASNTRRITIPKAAKATLDALTRKQATLVYASDTDKTYVDNGTTLVELAASASSGGLASVAPGSLITTNYTVVSGDNGRVLNVDTSSASIEITLPAPSAGFKVTIKDAVGNASTNNISILRDDSADKIDDVESDDTIFDDYGAISFVSSSTDWTRVASFTGGSPYVSGRGIFMGGSSAANVEQNIIDYVQIDTPGNATDFGDLTVARWMGGACSSRTRGILGGGGIISSTNVIDYITMSALGNATDFGDLTVARFGQAGCSNSTRGLFMGGTGGGTDEIDYITIASIGNATDFGDLSTTPDYYLGGLASTTRGVRGGSVNSPFNTIDYVTIATTGNATDFGDLTVGRDAVAGCSNSTRGLFMGGSGPSNIIEYITIATTGNATDFGDLTVVKYFPGACASSTRALCAGGSTTGPISGASDVIDYVTIASLGNATDFGDLTVARGNFPAGCSNAHGGL